MTTGYKYKTYRQEWVSTTGHVDQYGREFKADYEAAFPTREEAVADMERIAKYDSYLMRWVTGRNYHEGRVSYREVLVDTTTAD